MSEYTFQVRTKDGQFAIKRIMAFDEDDAKQALADEMTAEGSPDFTAQVLDG